MISSVPLDKCIFLQDPFTDWYAHCMQCYYECFFVSGGWHVILALKTNINETHIQVKKILDRFQVIWKNNLRFRVGLFEWRAERATLRNAHFKSESIVSIQDYQAVKGEIVKVFVWRVWPVWSVKVLRNTVHFSCITHKLLCTTVNSSLSTRGQTCLEGLVIITVNLPVS